MSSAIRYSNEEAEKHLLGSIMHAPHECLIVVEQMGADEGWFSQNATNKFIYLALREYVISGGALSGHAIDTVVFLRFLHSKGHTHIDFSMIFGIMSSVAFAHNVREYAEIVRDMYVVRTAREACLGILAGIESRAQTAAEICSELAVAAATAGMCAAGRSRQTTTEAAVDDIIRDIESGNSQAIFGLPTGFGALDEQIGGFQKGDMILIRGARGSGKSAFALNLAEAFDRAHRLGTAYFTYEMTVRQQVSRLIQLRGRTNIKDYMKSRGDLLHEKGALGLIKHGAESVKNSKIEFIEERPATIESVIQRTRIRASRGDLGLAVLDYDELLTLPPKVSKEEGLSEISASWKKVAGELGITTILLSQVTESKDGVLKARYSQAKENFANIILTVTENEDGSRSVSIDKNRDGARGAVVPFDFLGKISMFTCR